MKAYALTALMLAASSTAAWAGEVSTPPNAVYKSNVLPQDRRVFFGELHLHTTESFDAWIWGTKVTPDQAYKFARGETIHTENSYKFTEPALDALLASAGFSLERLWHDADERFAVTLSRST